MPSVADVHPANWATIDWPMLLSDTCISSNHRLVERIQIYPLCTKQIVCWVEAPVDGAEQTTATVKVNTHISLHSSKTWDWKISMNSWAGLGTEWREWLWVGISLTTLIIFKCKGIKQGSANLHGVALILSIWQMATAYRTQYKYYSVNSDMNWQYE